MRFSLVDRIEEVTPGHSIRAVKNLTLGEEYLADHFPTFPVMPGVLMLQTLIEAGAWLWRITDDFKYSMIVLREAKNVKYGQFMEPGKRMTVTVEFSEQKDDLADFKGKGESEGKQTVSARFVLARYNLAKINPAWKATDDRMLIYWRNLSALLRRDLSRGLAESA